MTFLPSFLTRKKIEDWHEKGYEEKNKSSVLREQRKGSTSASGGKGRSSRLVLVERSK